MLRHLQNVVQAAKGNARRVVVVGHSQGGALARALCVNNNSVDALMTVGSGAHLLAATRASRWRHIIVSWAAIPLYPLFVGWVYLTVIHLLAQIWRSLDDPSAVFFSGENARLWALWLLLYGLVWLRLWLGSRGGPREVPEEVGVPQVDTWIDVSSVYDPVCVGGASLDEAAIPVAVVNTKRLRELLSEHVQYFTNPAVGRTLLSVMTPPAQRRIEPSHSLWAETDPHVAFSWFWLWGAPLSIWGSWIVCSAWLKVTRALLA